MKAKYDLADILIRIGEQADTLENVAGDMLAAIKSARADTLDKFNALILEAYVKNSWITRTGKPSPLHTDKPAPDAVKVYVSTVRRGYRDGLDMMAYKTFGELRRDIRAHAEQMEQKMRPPELKGVHISTEGSFTGALWHDAVVLWEHLPETTQHQFELEIRKLVSKYLKSVPDDLAQAA